MVIEKNDDQAGYPLMQKIEKDWFMSKQCLLFYPFITVNIALFITYVVLYYLALQASRVVDSNSSPQKEADVYKM